MTEAHTDRKQVLFIQGAGDGAYEEDEKLAASLREALGQAYVVHYPRMPENASTDAAWMEQLREEFAALKDDVILVGHSVGGSALLKYLAENTVPVQIRGIFLLATPFWGKGGWDYEGFSIPNDFPDRLPKGVPIFLYHNRDDEVVEFAHLALYRAELPNATTREGASGGHQFGNDLTQVAQDIRSLQ